LSWERLSRELKCPKCGATGQFTYKEPNGHYMGGGMFDEEVSDGFRITKNTGIAVTSEVSCSQCNIVVKEASKRFSADPLPSTASPSI
jgi:phage FluMu protein Com